MGKEKKRIYKILIASLFVLAISLIIYDIFFGNMGFLEYLSMKEKYKILEDKSKRVSEEITEMEKEEKNLKENMNYIEDIAREELGLIRDREKIIILEDEGEKSDEESVEGAD